MRCESCSKFVAFDCDAEPEDVAVEIDESTGDLSGTCRITNSCADCGTELTSADLDLALTSDVTETRGRGKKRKTTVISRGSSSSFEDWRAGVDPDSEGWTYALKDESPSGERTDRSEGLGRYARRYYGAEVEVEVEATNTKTGETATWTGVLAGECPASGMEPC